MKLKSSSPHAFTLIEMLVVIGIIVILAGLLFPTFGAVKNSALKTQAANEEQQIITATKAYFTDYGKYPLTTPQSNASGDTVYSNPDKPIYFNEQIITILRGLPHGDDGKPAASGTTTYPYNPRQTVYLEIKDAKDKTAPKGGISPKGSTNEGRYMDPWGTPYVIFVDGNYDNQLNSYFDVYLENTDNPLPRVGIAVASFGKDKLPGKMTSATAGDKKLPGSDDVVSWR